jgi:hypothetical protein
MGNDFLVVVFYGAAILYFQQQWPRYLNYLTVHFGTSLGCLQHVLGVEEMFRVR